VGGWPAVKDEPETEAKPPVEDESVSADAEGKASSAVEPASQSEETAGTTGAIEPPAIAVHADDEEHDEPGVIPSDSEIPDVPDEDEESGDGHAASNPTTTWMEQPVESNVAALPATVEKKVPIWMRKQEPE
jgi:hypothetical protein